jgi:hypothetical protein
MQVFQNMNISRSDEAREEYFSSAISMEWEGRSIWQKGSGLVGAACEVGLSGSWRTWFLTRRPTKKLLNS